MDISDLSLRELVKDFKDALLEDDFDLEDAKECLDHIKLCCTQRRIDLNGVVMNLKGVPSSHNDENHTTFLRLGDEDDESGDERLLFAIEPLLLSKKVDENGAPLKRARSWVNQTVLEIHQKMEELGFSLEKASIRDQRTVLHQAITAGHTEQLEFYLQKVSAQTINGKFGGENLETSLAWAIKKGQMAMAKRLISAGADVNEPDRLQNTPLHLAVAAGHLEMVELLIQNRAIVGLLNTWGQKCIMNLPFEGDPAGLENSCKILKLLQERGASINDQDYSGITMLHVAAYEAPVAMLKMIISQSSSLEVRCQEGQTPLHCAVRLANSESLDNVICLVEAGADLHAQIDEGLSVLELAELNDDPAIGSYIKSVILAQKERAELDKIKIRAKCSAGKEATEASLAGTSEAKELDHMSKVGEAGGNKGHKVGEKEGVGHQELTQNAVKRQKKSL